MATKKILAECEQFLSNGIINALGEDSLAEFNTPDTTFWINIYREDSYLRLEDLRAYVRKLDKENTNVPLIGTKYEVILLEYQEWPFPFNLYQIRINGRIVEKEVLHV